MMANHPTCKTCIAFAPPEKPTTVYNQPQQGWCHLNPDRIPAWSDHWCMQHQLILPASGTYTFVENSLGQVSAPKKGVKK